MKRLSFFPVVAIQGARQTGKSTLARTLMPKRLQSARYFSLDDLATRRALRESPRTFIAENADAKPLIFDEAQKAPEIFDAIKFDVDQERVPGKFLLLGSTEFSKLARIRESLTGRMGRVRLFPMNIQETLELGRKPASQAQVLHYLQRGGMPLSFAVRDTENWRAIYQDWVDLTCMRDLQQFERMRTDSDLAREILRLCSTLEEPTLAEISRATQIDSRRVQTHLLLLKELFVLIELKPHPSGFGKPIYLPFEVGLAHYFGASLRRRLQIWLVSERIASNAYHDNETSQFYSYRSRARSRLDLIEDHPGRGLVAYQIFEQERLKLTQLELVRSFAEKNKKAELRVFAPFLHAQTIGGIRCEPWERLLRTG